MSQLTTASDLTALAPEGYYIALRIGFGAPLKEINRLPEKWVEHYTLNRYVILDPVLRWAYRTTGIMDWQTLRDDDPNGILSVASSFGLKYGVVTSTNGSDSKGKRSFGSFARSDRPFNALESKLLFAYVTRLHEELLPAATLTKAETAAIRLVRDGWQLKRIAFELNVTEGAIKQRLKKIKEKLNAKTSAEAANLASELGLI